VCILRVLGSNATTGYTERIIIIIIIIITTTTTTTESTAYGILSSNLLSVLIPYVDGITVDHQCGFRRNCSTTDHIFWVRDKANVNTYVHLYKM